MHGFAMGFDAKFQTLFAQAGVLINQRPYYHKWLRYYLDFCHKY